MLCFSPFHGYYSQPLPILFKHLTTMRGDNVTQCPDSRIYRTWQEQWIYFKILIASNRKLINLVLCYLKSIKEKHSLSASHLNMLKQELFDVLSWSHFHSLATWLISWQVMTKTTGICSSKSIMQISSRPLSFIEPLFCPVCKASGLYFCL